MYIIIISIVQASAVLAETETLNRTLSLNINSLLNSTRIKFCFNTWNIKLSNPVTVSAQSKAWNVCTCSCVRIPLETHMYFSCILCLCCPAYSVALCRVDHASKRSWQLSFSFRINYFWRGTGQTATIFKIKEEGEITD
jgi:hypothetical protein